MNQRFLQRIVAILSCLTIMFYSCEQQTKIAHKEASPNVAVTEAQAMRQNIAMLEVVVVIMGALLALLLIEAIIRWYEVWQRRRLTSAKNDD